MSPGMKKQSKPPNLILICSDQHRADSIGAYGNGVCQTPNLDKLAGQGVLFERCYVQNPVCSPQRASIMTGCLGRRHGVLNNGIPLTRELPTIADVLQSGGYRTAAFGKLHLRPQNEGVGSAPFYGFEHLAPVEDHKVGPYLDWVLAEYPQYEGYILGTLFNLPTDEAYWRGKRDLRQEYLEARKKHVTPLEISATCNWGFGHYNPMPAEAHQNRWISNQVRSYLDACDGDEPLFLWIGFVDPHNPFDPPEPFRGMYPPDKVDPRIFREGEQDQWTPPHRALYEYFKVFTEDDWRALRALYYGSVSFMDQEIGRIVAALEDKLDMSNTAIVYTADHGEILGDHGICGKSAYHYDSCIRVPLICRWDACWLPGARPREIIESTDLAATLLETMGIEARPVMDGKSFAPLLHGAHLADPRGHAFAESYAGGPEDPTPAPHTWARTIRTHRWRATFYPGAEHGELFDLENDPEEMTNLWASPEHRGVIEEHRRILLDRLILMDYPLRKRTHSV